jgi:acetyl esterase/lipase
MSARDISVIPRIHALYEKGGTCPPVWVTSGSIDPCIDPQGVENMVRLMQGYGMEVEWELRKGKGHSFDFEVDEEALGLRRFLENHLL